MEDENSQLKINLAPGLDNWGPHRRSFKSPEAMRTYVQSLGGRLPDEVDKMVYMVACRGSTALVVAG